MIRLRTDRLFIDVDGTLVNWGRGGTPANPFEEPYELNAAVIDYARRWLNHKPNGQLIVWSGGGADYARTWAHRAFGDWPFTISWAAKGPIALQEGDLFIDDSPAKEWAPLSIHPGQLPR